MDITIPLELRAKALEEVTAHHAKIWGEVTDHGTDDESIQLANEIWLKDLIRQLMPATDDRLPDFSQVNDYDLHLVMKERWMTHRRNVRRFCGEDGGLSQETVTAIIAHLIRTY